MAIMFDDYLLDSVCMNDSANAKFVHVYVCDVVNVDDTEVVTFINAVHDLVTVDDLGNAVSSEETTSEAFSEAISEATSDQPTGPGGHFSQSTLGAGGARVLRRMGRPGPLGPFASLY